MATAKLDFGAGFDVTESPADEFNIDLDLTEKPVNLATEVTGDLPLANIAPAGAASLLLGRRSTGSGDWEPCTAESPLTFSGTILAVLPATLALAGKVELATTAEINAGTDFTRAMPVDQFVASNRNMRYILYRVLDPATSHTAVSVVGGDLEIPFACSFVAADIGAYVDTAGVTGVATIDIKKNGTTIFSTKITIDSAEKSSRTAAAVPVLVASPTTLAAGDVITVDIVAPLQTTPAKGLTIRLGVKVI